MDSGARQGWDGMSWPRGSRRLPAVTCDHPWPPVILRLRGTTMLPPHPARFQDGASPLELLVGNF